MAAATPLSRAAEGRGIRVLIAKLGLDSHYRGAIIVARYLIDRGMEVVYLGNQLPGTIAEAATQEDVDVVGLSCLSGNHMIMVPRVMDELRHHGRRDVMVLVGGTIPEADREPLLACGVSAVFATGSGLHQIADYIESTLERRSAR